MPGRSGLEVLTSVRETHPQIRVIMVSIPRGSVRPAQHQGQRGRLCQQVLTSVRETHPQIRVIMVSMYPEDQYALRSIKAGAGYAQGGRPGAADRGRAYRSCRPQVPDRRGRADAGRQPGPASRPVPHEALSEREMQTLLKIASGQRQTDIAQELMLSPKTVSVYRARVLEKLGLSSNAELTAYAIHNKLI